MDFKEIIKTNQYSIKNIIKKVTNEENEDLEQEVYLKVWQNSEKYKELGKFKSWILTIAKNLSKDYLKSANFRHSQNSTSDETILNTIKDTKVTPDKVFANKLRQKRIYNAINELKPKFKEVIILSEIQDMSYEKISEKLNIPLGTVKSRIYNAKKELSEKLADLI